MLVEGEEEIGSPALPGFLDAFRDALRADVVVFADAGNWTADIPALTTSLRGGTSVVVEVRTLRHGVHSGMYGGPAPDALTALCRMLASLHDERGDVAVPGLTRGTADEADPLDLTEEQFRAEAGMLDGVRLTGTGGLTDRLWAGPAIAVIGIDAPSVAAASNTLIPVARAKVSMRMAPGDDAAAACDALAAHLTAHAPWGAQVSVQPGAFAAPFTARSGGRAYRCARSALGEAWGTAGRGRRRGRVHPLRHRLRRPVPRRGDPDHRGGRPRHAGRTAATRACTWPPSSGPAWPRPCCCATWPATTINRVGVSLS